MVGGLSADQYKILGGAIAVSEKKMSEAMKPWADVKYLLDMDTVISEEEMQSIRTDLYSRKPIVLDKNDPKKKHLVIGILLTRLYYLI